MASTNKNGLADHNFPGRRYDVVVNGVKPGGGSIRIHQSDVQKMIFEVALN